jgi:shikimate kinase
MGESAILVGPRCSGKTLAGKELARILETPFVDADDIFVEMCRKNVEAYVAEYGWEGFRKAETKAIEEICREYQHVQIVLTPGGGAVAHDQGEEYRQRNVKLLQAFGTIIYLLPEADLEKSAGILTDRLLADPTTAGQRPSLTGEQDQYKDMLTAITKRHTLYSAAANITFYTGKKTVEEVAKNIAVWIK